MTGASPLQPEPSQPDGRSPAGAAGSPGPGPELGLDASPRGTPTLYQAAHDEPTIYHGGPAIYQSVHAMPVRWYRRPLARIGLSAVVIGVIALGGLVMLIVLGSALGVGALVLAAVAALLPVPVLIGGLMWLDRYEPEPWQLLTFAFGWGACVATAGAYFLNNLGSGLIHSAFGSQSRLAAVLIAPPVEEILKAAPVFLVLLLMLVGRREVHGVVDGIVYTGMSAVGFAFTENVLYFGAQYVEAASKGTNRDGLVALFWLFLLRGVFSPFAHPLFTCLTGIGVGLAVRSRRWSVRLGAPLGGLALAILLHALWNLFAASRDFTVIALGYLLIMLPAFVVMVSAAIWRRSSEARVVSDVLPEYAAAGWLTEHDILSLSTMRAQKLARWWAKRVAGPQGARAMQDFQFAATKLALLRESLTMGFARPGRDLAEQERELLARITESRRLLAPFGHPPLPHAASHFPPNHPPPTQPA